ncbi:MAG TPA: lysylphosphatidylglycerol synthase transmembrane domain-containing protein [Bacteroidales bacterium]|nr:lysylphosphatidylglycerol synthase transmembrane domain-containing protein [Bacteroidales bacterium]
MHKLDKNSINNFKSNRAILPAVIGLGIVSLFVYRDFNKIDFSLFSVTYLSFILLFCAFGMLFFRDFGYVLRMRVLSSGELTWLQCIKIVFLWEFGSAITPSAVGGTAIATIFLWKEGLTVGKSTSIVMATSFLDELYFTIMFPSIVLIFSSAQLFPTDKAGFVYNNLLVFALIGYSLKLSWTLLMAYSLFIKPQFFAKLVKSIFKIRFLRKWNDGAEKMAKDFVIANKELKKKKIGFWIKSILSTFISWTARYFVLNFIFLALVLSIKSGDESITVFEHLLIFARQLVMWILMLVMPTPGGSGFVETVFTTYMADFVPVAGFTVIMALLWRLVTYYPYLIIGAIITPSWLKSNFKIKRK